MTKLLIVILMLLTGYSFAETDAKLPNQIEQKAEEEEIIGGIGGTGLMDMERPELLERPELELDDLIDTGSDAEFSPGDVTDESGDMLDPSDMEQP